MNQINKILNILLLSIIGSSLLKAQLMPITIEEKLTASESIIEGTVIAQQSYKDINGDVYTENIIEVDHVLIGEVNTYKISVITMGGTIDNIATTWTHVLSLNLNEHGAFFLIKTERSIRQGSSYKQYDVFSGAQGFYHYLDIDSKIEAVAALSHYKDLNSFYRSLDINDDITSPKVNYQSSPNDLSCLEYTIESTIPSNLSGQNTSALFDVKVRLPDDNKSLYKSEFQIKYSSDWYGTNIVQNQNISFQLEPTLSSKYNLVLTDVNDTIVNFTLTSNTTNYSDLIEVSNDDLLIGSIELNIEGIGSEDPVEADFSSEDIENRYLTEDGYEHDFDCVTLDFIDGSCRPKITSITKKHGAGSGDIIVIKGSNFVHQDVGDSYCDVLPDDQHRILFKTLDLSVKIAPFSKDYLLWTPTEIQVKVPSLGYQNYTLDQIKLGEDQHACTGKVEVCTRMSKNRSWCKCKDTYSNLYVPYAAVNSKQIKFHPQNNSCDNSYETKLRNLSGNGSYILSLGPNFIKSLGIDGKKAFVRAMNAWRCNIKFNFELGSGGIPIEYTKLPPGTLGTTKFIITKCNTDKTYIQFLSMQFNNGESWNLKDNKPKSNEIDFEAVATHELGHSLGLLHTNNKDDIMYPIAAPRGKEKAIHADDIQGGTHRVQDGKTTVNNCHNPVVELTGNCTFMVGSKNIYLDEEGIQINNIIHNNELMIYGDNLIGSNSPYNIQLINMSGEEVFNQFIKLAPTNYLDINHLSNGIFIILIRNNNNRIIFKDKLFKY